MNFTLYKIKRSRLRKVKMNEFSCQMYIGAHASFNPVLARTNINKVAKLSHISHKELIEPSMRQLMAAFESLPKTSTP